MADNKKPSPPLVREHFKAHQAVRRLSLQALLFALCLVLSRFETLLPPPGPFPVKYGLANIPVMYALLSMGLPSALLLAVFKSLFALAARGAMAGLLSFAGGLASVLVMYGLDRLTRSQISLILISSLGAVTHNLAQFCIILILFRASASAAFYGLLPPLILLGLAAGVLTGLSLSAVKPYLALSEKKPGSEDGTRP